MKIGIIGRERSGKSTIYGGLTGTDISNQFEKKIYIKTVDVFDDRVPKLAKLYNSKKEIYNKLEFHDFPGYDLNGSDLKSMDGYIIVLDNFSNDESSQSQLETVFSEMYLRDLEILQKRFDLIKRGKKEKDWGFEAKIIQDIIKLLDNEKHLYKSFEDSDKVKSLRGFQLFSLKPIFVLINNKEGKTGALTNDFDLPYLNVMGEIELEIALLPDNEKKEYLEMMGLKEGIVKKFTKQLYDYLNLITFLSCSEKEIKAWPLKKGQTIHEAAGVIHTDIMQGFVKAELIHCSDLISAGGEKEAKEKGLYLLEGKGYIVQDGDIVDIRFQKNRS
ncbi:DUF933 domain-containing protein [bacterium]|nr:DUF933 domain-containing protein [bacterium]